MIPGGRIEDSSINYGIVVEKERTSLEMPKRIENARIMLLEGTLELKKLDTDAKVTITEAKNLSSFKEGEEKVIKVSGRCHCRRRRQCRLLREGHRCCCPELSGKARNIGSSPGQERGSEDAGPGHGRETGGRCDGSSPPRIWDRQLWWKSARSAKTSR